MARASVCRPLRFVGGRVEGEVAGPLDKGGRMRGPAQRHTDFVGAR
jgi:hypothetical protein